MSHLQIIKLLYRFRRLAGIWNLAKYRSANSFYSLAAGNTYIQEGIRECVQEKSLV